MKQEENDSKTTPTPKPSMHGKSRKSLHGLIIHTALGQLEKEGRPAVSDWDGGSSYFIFIVANV
ncbi:hypothetical protein BOTCAL_0455g00040 [Botryotinia calthae]|uniref:Uncharacterized protein n=1 Tax=Botryotinia calthae TaxID=38488 RepID=A0A4Y8CQH3_9HELO|nr:hypothetical protein BOTCAL_0455g00040 [Botryotinia calthae]